ncbi:helix-turn-helix domain-containing protein [Streptomyces marincola]|uniref:helix-turn-helix domain-containing protein n=1 Tax=Streptomyces marincola TaxID=2878388 RepID=UPI001CF43870|nr:helix-turn-helix transcriptional regulator [Streptomyces marincola]UCM87709.1 helix-turn-helix transcriptional regulator [Streptomyces marincola]
MTSSTAFRDESGTARLLSRVAKAPDALTLFAETSDHLRKLLPYDASVWRAVDPLTGLMAAPIRAENLDEGGCAVYWECELFTENVNLYRDLAQAPLPVAGLRQTTGDLPARSTLYQDFMKPRGFGDELRAVLRIGGRPHGHISLFRNRGRPAFGADETRLIAGLLSPLARALRSFAEPPVAHPLPDAPGGPGLMLFDASGALLSVNDEARAYLEDLPPGPTMPSALGIQVPAWVHSTALKARAISQERDHGQARVRVRTRAGRWLVCHASCLREANGVPGPSAVVVEPARTSEIVPLIVDAFELTEREIEVTQCIARGLPTGRIAQELHLSPHTVRDHVKAVFEKVQVSSRGELVGKLFTEYYSPPAEANMVRARVS